jgi:hypothetical protein
MFWHRRYIILLRIFLAFPNEYEERQACFTLYIFSTYVQHLIFFRLFLIILLKLSGHEGDAI